MEAKKSTCPDRESIGGHPGRTSGNPNGIWQFRQHRQLFHQATCAPDVILIVEGNPIELREFDSDVSDCSHASILPCRVTRNSGIVDRTDNFNGLICGAIINNNNHLQRNH